MILMNGRGVIAEDVSIAEFDNQFENLTERGQNQDQTPRDKDYADPKLFSSFHHTAKNDGDLNKANKESFM